MLTADAAALARSISGPCAVVHDEERVIVASDPDEVVIASGVDAFRALDRLADGWWCGWMTYNLGRAAQELPSRSAHADLVLIRFATRLTLDPRSPVVGQPRVHPAAGPHLERPEAHWTSNLSREAWDAAVATIHDHERAGDCYQVNLARLLHTETVYDPRALFHSLATVNPAPHGALIDARSILGRAVVSASPERFLRSVGAQVMTQPIKGTDADAERLLHSAKDRTENTMIVDLARNDLGRVCTFGSVRTPDLCTLVAHPGLFHFVSTVSGTLRDDVGFGELLRSTAPAASITGAPKHRVMQIIDALEPDDRGVYCGSVGWIDTTTARAEWNVAIRTFEIGADGTQLGVGAGITIESHAAQEWEETELKAHRLLAATAPAAVVSS